MIATLHSAAFFMMHLGMGVAWKVGRRERSHTRALQHMY